ncbi:hypothetical protein M9H77_09718 [Catharanthus roseus]|uniref:Uncharacterized protein n=1 Tax=Catharanthus roseus TaxID=4058 RepID=A0ACC0C1V0_CATRO|nr:hypothetical protein M9H77_09718 [Catharanthus roseus]
MQWFIPRTHPRIQNPERIPRGFHVPVVALMPLSVLMGTISCEIDHDDVEKEERSDKIFKLVKRHYHVSNKALPDRLLEYHNDIAIARATEAMCIHLASVAE